MLKDFKGYGLKEIVTEVTEFLQKEDFTLLYLKETVFFPESAGQIGDSGIIIFDEIEYKIIGLAISDNKVVHKVEKINNIKVGSPIKAKIDSEKRYAVSKNHSAAHLLFDTLREMFPTSVGKGYFNDEYGLRIDMQIEEKIDWGTAYIINKRVTEKRRTVSYKEEIIVDAKTAKEQYNLSIEFNNKEIEGDLRIVKFGDVSMQLCSGTHVDNLLEIPEFVIVNFETKGKNIYRFYAITETPYLYKYLDSLQTDEWAEMLVVDARYETYKNKYGRDEMLESVFDNFFALKKDLEGSNRDTFFKLKILISDLRKNMERYMLMVESKRKDELYKKYIDIKPDIAGENNIFIIKDGDLETKEMNFICDLILKNNSNSYVEVIDKFETKFFCKSNCSIIAIERMKNHDKFNVEGGGNAKTAQGKIIWRDELN
ncbi:alanine--tRNA ligase-related protein [Spiroplasma monobiae]|uniref:Alanyl-tRNA synthetase n=1 Tax=Spiroplasma monobiae MQ-1 TaxID=1336748 RepID=A0A2K9LWJ4_SPISQ|nr:alanyl-tRNA editing protein [Spiroplasma monobiae]AUM62765.1 alanyl-tRNA synthetase [Spiroplasma monobiae MQ-1]